MTKEAFRRVIDWTTFSILIAVLLIAGNALALFINTGYWIWGCWK